jgi:hypothetical protein
MRVRPPSQGANRDCSIRRRRKLQRARARVRFGEPRSRSFESTASACPSMGPLWGDQSLASSDRPPSRATRRAAPCLRRLSAATRTRHSSFLYGQSGKFLGLKPPERPVLTLTQRDDRGHQGSISTASVPSANARLSAMRTKPSGRRSIRSYASGGRSSVSRPAVSRAPVRVAALARVPGRDVTLPARALHHPNPARLGSRQPQG